jgi:chemotaxis-related protein WspB
VESVDPQRIAPSGVAAAPFLGDVASNGIGMLQLVDLDGLLPANVRALLFQDKAAA